jgi:hypothetical protein
MKKKIKTLSFKKKHQLRPQTLWEIIFFGAILIITLEFLASSFLFLRVTHTFDAPPSLTTDATLEKITALHHKVQSVQDTVSTRVNRE